MPMRYFKKMYPNQPLVLSSGQGVKFPPIHRDLGAVATADEKLIREFKMAEEQRIGGVEEITQAEYEELKKKAPPPNWNESVSGKQVHLAHLAAQRAAAERAAKPTQFTPVSRALRNAGKPLNEKTFRPGTVDRP